MTELTGSQQPLGAWRGKRQRSRRPPPSREPGTAGSRRICR
jgi:hypothetical protein